MDNNPKSMIHFGVRLRPGQLGPIMTREKYAPINNKVTGGKRMKEYDDLKRNRGIAVDRTSIYDEFEGVKYQVYADEAGLFYTDEWCEMNQKRCLINYDLNIEYFASLDREDFEEEIKEFKIKYKSFIEIDDLNEYESTSGYYVMVLGEYKQVYVGTSNNIKRRILQHWSKKKEFDRLLWPIGNRGIYVSRISIDSFRAQDTTKIFVFPTKTYLSISLNEEDDIKNFFSDEFVVNRIMGGPMDTPAARLEAIVNTKNRKLK
ncbi:GIY-YIG nuclease family protein [Erysipelothrix rhusiopathiae]|nr:GIY-YIG nuclease family protein [Erysipelothrix rhusiopathiae]